MKNLVSHITFVAIGISILCSCSSSRQTVTEVDDIYFTRGDRNNSIQATEFSSANSAIGNNEDNTTEIEYFSIGQEAPRDASNIVNTENDFPQNGNTIINNYGTSNYYDYDESYATQIRRFNSAGIAATYSYYDPFYCAPNWNYGWSFINTPYYMPYYGWNFSYNSYWGWNLNNNWMWGYPYYLNYYPNRFYRNYYDPYWAWNAPYYGTNFGGFYGNSYWNGYENGYIDGFYDGLGNNNRPTSTGRRNVATNSGFNNRTERGNNPNNSSTVSKIANNQIATTNAEYGRLSTELIGNGVLPPHSISKPDVHTSSNGVKQVSIETSKNMNETVQIRQNANDFNLQNNAQPNIKQSQSNNHTAVTRNLEKYQTNGPTRAGQVNTKSNQKSISSSQNSIRGNSVNSTTRTTKPATSGSSYGNTRPIYGDRQTQPSKNQSTPKNTDADKLKYTAPSQTNRNYAPQPNYRNRTQTKPAPERNTYTPSHNATSPNRSYSPSRSSAPSRSATPTPSRSNAPVRNNSAPSRNTTPSGSGINRSPQSNIRR